jgi:hypothetical protein
VSDTCSPAPALPSPRTSVDDAPPLGLAALVALQARLADEMLAAVHRLRLLDTPWRVIAHSLGQPLSSVHRRYRWVDDAPIDVVRGDGQASAHFYVPSTGVVWREVEDLGAPADTLAWLRRAVAGRASTLTSCASAPVVEHAP